MDNKLNWLDRILDDMGWTPADLSRATKLDSAVISNIRNGKREIGLDTAIAIAKATNRSPETILRMAGKLPDSPNVDEEIEQILHEINKLNKADQQEVLAYIRMKRNLRDKKK
jgi:plasmid maintenance system antidote protein VapI